LSREEIIATYDQGPDTEVPLMEELVTTFQKQIEQLIARVK
jgi:hypothetical protein